MPESNSRSQDDLHDHHRGTTRDSRRDVDLNRDARITLADEYPGRPSGLR